MRRPRIAFLDEATVGGGDLSAIKAMGEYTAWPLTAPEQVVARAAGADIVITNKVRIGKSEMESLPDLRLICIAATGMNIIDLDEAARRGIEVRNVAGYSTEGVTETTIGDALALLRNLPFYDAFIKDGGYTRDGMFVSFRRPTSLLSERRWGIIGLGAIGHSVAAAATALGCPVAYCSTSGVERDEPYPRMDLDSLLAWADVVSVHCPLTASTQNLISARELSLMKPDAILINVARGGIVNEKDLADALDSETIMGAALDVYPQEPMPLSSPLLGIRDPWRIILSPHNAWAAREELVRLIAGIESNIRTWLEKADVR